MKSIQYILSLFSTLILLSNLVVDAFVISNNQKLFVKSSTKQTNPYSNKLTVIKNLEPLYDDEVRAKYNNKRIQMDFLILMCFHFRRYQKKV